MNATASYYQRLAAGDSKAQSEVWDAFFCKLVRLATKRLRKLPQAAADGEDIAVTALSAFYLGISQDKFPNLEYSDDLWKLLATLTIRRTVEYARRELASKRGGLARHVSWSMAGEESLELMSSFERTYEMPFWMKEYCDDLLAELDDELREIAQLKWEGHSNEEIAEKLACTVRTIERKLARIRSAWQHRLLAAS